MNDTFKIVSYKKKRNVKFKEKCCIVAEDKNVFKPLNFYKGKIESAETEVKCSSFYSTLLSLIEEQVKIIKPNDKPVIDDLLCYGLGSFINCIGSRYQLALLLCLKKHFGSTVSIYDPCFIESENQLLKDYNFNVIQTNEEGKRSIDKLTLLFLPHCPHWLVNNLLWKNWGENLKNCILISNSFKGIILETPTKLLKSEYKYLLEITSKSCVKEISILNNFKYDDIFNSLSLHIFPSETINKLISNQTSNDFEEPVYLDEFIIKFSKINCN